MKTPATTPLTGNVTRITALDGNDISIKQLYKYNRKIYRHIFMDRLLWYQDIHTNHLKTCVWIKIFHFPICWPLTIEKILRLWRWLFLINFFICNLIDLRNIEIGCGLVSLFYLSLFRISSINLRNYKYSSKINYLDIERTLTV